MNWVIIGSGNGFVACSACSRSQRWLIGNWAHRNKLQWNSNQNTFFSFMEMHLKMTHDKWWPFCRWEGAGYNAKLVSGYHTHAISSIDNGSSYLLCFLFMLLPRRALQWRHNERDGVSNHCGLCEGNPPVTGGIRTQRAIDAENVSMWWRRHEVIYCPSSQYWNWNIQRGAVITRSLFSKILTIYTS